MEQKSFLKNMIGFSLVTWISFAIGLIASPIATRLFEPVQKGHIDLFCNYAGLFSAVCYLGLDQAFVRFFREPPGNATRKGMLSFCAGASLLFSLIVSGVMFFGWQTVSGAILGQADMSIYLCLCLYNLCSVLYRFLSLCYRMEQNAKLYTIQGVCYVLLTKLAYLSVGFGSAQAKPAILLLTLLMSVFSIIFLWAQRNRFERYRPDRPFVREMSRFAAPLIPLSVMAWVNSSIALPLLNGLIDAGAVGVYTSALALASTVNIVQTGFNTYWAPYVYEHYQNDENRRFYTVHRLMACLLTGFGLTVTLLEPLVFLLLGAKFRGSMLYFPFLFLSPICYCLGETTGMGVNISKKTYWNTIIFCVSSLVNIGLCLWLIPLLDAAGAAIASASAAITSLSLRTLVGEHYYKAIDSPRYLLYAVGLMLLISVSNYLLQDLALVRYAVFAAIYAIALFLFRHELKTLFQTLTKLLKPKAKENAHE